MYSCFSERKTISVGVWGKLFPHKKIFIIIFCSYKINLILKQSKNKGYIQ